MFDKKGLTSSEASHIANFLKELVKNIDVTTDNFKVMTSVGIRDGQPNALDTNKAIEDWDSKLLAKARYYSLSAWLKEAIKIKDSQLTKARTMASNIEIELKKTPARPSLKATEWVDFFLTQMTIKDQAMYLQAEANASHIGQFIHNFDDVRSKLDNYKPTEFHKLSSTETMTVQNQLLYDKDELLGTFENLQSLHRESEKLVNFWKAKHKEWKAQQEMEFQTAVQKWSRESSAINIENNNLLKTQEAQFEIERTRKVEEISALKIVIPNSLQPILDEVYEKLK